MLNLFLSRLGLGVAAGTAWGRVGQAQPHAGALQAAWKRRVILILILILIVSVHSGAVNCYILFARYTCMGR
jgi:hypothetical protein